MPNDISDIDIYRSANELLKHHGDAAAMLADQRAAALAHAGDLAGCAVWRRIGVAIEDLRRQRPSDGEPTH